MVALSLNQREVAQIVAALRNWLYDLEEGQDLEEAFIGHFSQHTMMEELEVESLIRRFRFDECQGVADFSQL